MKKETVNKSLINGVVDKYTHFPQGKYITLVVQRTTESECIFRTEGSGEGMNKELVQLGIKNQEIFNRVTISKRKQAAVERRTGRELLRSNDLLFKTSKNDICELNKNTPCGKCLDCMVFGYAVGDGGAQKSRVIYDNAYSILTFDEVTDKKTFNALYENGTMRDEKGNASSSINEDEYVKPGTVFLDMITCKDLTLDELTYVLGNILRSKRYGAISSRIGKMKNSLLKIFVSDCELFSNLELTQGVYDNLSESKTLNFPLKENEVIKAVDLATENLKKSIFGVVEEVNVSEIINYLSETFKNKDSVKEILENQSKQYGEK